MRKLLVILLLGWLGLCHGQYNTIITFHSGISKEQFAMKNLMNEINDTSQYKFDFVSASPTFSYTHEFVMGQVLSISANLGFQYTNVRYNYQHLGSPYLYFSLNPAVNIVHRKKFDYYVKLRAGVSFWFYERSLLPDGTRKFFPDLANMFTGVTLGGFNYFLNEHWGLNMELSIWSPELATFGVNYRFFRGELPEIQDNENEQKF